jgi:hypothetical protein
MVAMRPALVFMLALSSYPADLTYVTYVAPGFDCGAIAVDFAGNAIAGCASAAGSFVAKISADGSRILFTSDILGGGVAGPALDSQGDILVAGQAKYTAGGFAAKLNGITGELVWIVPVLISSASLAVDSLGNIYIAGYSGTPGLGTYVLKLSRDGTKVMYFA